MSRLRTLSSEAAPLGLTQVRQLGAAPAPILELYDAIMERFPKLWPEVEAACSVAAVLRLKRAANPVALFFEGPLKQIDLLPRIRHKVFLTPELGPTLSGRDDDLTDKFTVLTRVLDGRCRPPPCNSVIRRPPRRGMAPASFPKSAEVGKVGPGSGHQITNIGDAIMDTPDAVNGKVGSAETPLPPHRQPNSATRTREHLTPAEVARLITAAGKVGRHGPRDATLLLLAYRHGLRVSELVDLQWSQIEFQTATLHVTRRKNGKPAAHPLTGDELRALRRLRAADPHGVYVFMTERGGPLTTSNVRKLVARAGRLAKLGFPVHPHMLRHAAGYYLANQGTDTRVIQDYLGHRNITHTVRYTELAPHRFRGLWKD